MAPAPEVVSAPQLGQAGSVLQPAAGAPETAQPVLPVALPTVPTLSAAPTGIPHVDPAASSDVQCAADEVKAWQRLKCTGNEVTYQVRLSSPLRRALSGLVGVRPDTHSLIRTWPH